MGKRIYKDSPAEVPAKDESGELFLFAKKILAEESNAPIAWVRDVDVCRLIYEGYPYGNYWKKGTKDVGRAIEMDLLARNLGIPLQWVLNILEGKWNQEQAFAAYIKKRKRNKHYFHLQQSTPEIDIQLDITLKESSPEKSAILGGLIRDVLLKHTNHKE